MHTVPSEMQFVDMAWQSEVVPFTYAEHPAKCVHFESKYAHPYVFAQFVPGFSIPGQYAVGSVALGVVAHDPAVVAVPAVHVHVPKDWQSFCDLNCVHALH